MRHNRDDVCERTVREFERLDRLARKLTPEDWERPLPRPETKDPWTVKDALVHITYWKANTVRVLRKERKPPEERGFEVNDLNHLIYLRWRNHTPAEVLAWHQAVQQELLAALQSAPDEWFGGKEHGPDWPYDLDGHSAYHRIKDIEQALTDKPEQPEK